MKLVKQLGEIDDYDAFSKECQKYGVFSNVHTLEVDLFQEDDDYKGAVIETLREGPFGKERQRWIDEWEASPDKLVVERFLSLIENIGKGRFAQRLAGRIANLEPPAYIADAIRFVAERV